MIGYLKLQNIWKYGPIKNATRHTTPTKLYFVCCCIATHGIHGKTLALPDPFKFLGFVVRTICRPPYLKIGKVSEKFQECSEIYAKKVRQKFDSIPSFFYCS